MCALWLTLQIHKLFVLNSQPASLYTMAAQIVQNDNDDDDDDGDSGDYIRMQ